MIHPIYKFELSNDGTTFTRVYPVYKNDLSKDFQLQQNEEFYRASLSGKLTFENEDFSFINSSAFETEFELRISISYNAGQTWALYWVGRFWKTDCEFNDDDQTVIVQPEVYDEYNDVLAGMDKEYDLIELAPEIEQIQIDKRPMVQIYVPGDSVIACFLSGMYWEQDCEPVTDENLLTQTGNGKYNFVKCASQRSADITGNTTPVLPVMFNGAIPASGNSFEYSNGGYKLKFEHLVISGGAANRWQIIRESDSTTLWSYLESSTAIRTTPYTVILNPVSGAGATGTVELYVHDVNVYGRCITDSPTIGPLSTYTLPTNDIVENNRNYARVIGFALDNTIYFSGRISNTPTQWGLYRPGQYYQQPVVFGNPTLFPVAKSVWTRLSIWFSISFMDWYVEELGRKAYTLKDAFPISSVISVLLAKVAPGITHEATTQYSQFLYGVNLIGGTDYRLYITPKSNILAGNYDQPAQKAPITLKQITDMLRDCFRCYWFIDNGKLRIEHIEYFRNGGSYTGAPVVGVDLTQQQVVRNGKKWAFATSKYTYDKPEMPERYQFGWMDDVTRPFEGLPIDVLSKYVTPGNIEEINVSNFTSDVDYMLLNPEECSEDGFALLSVQKWGNIRDLTLEAGSLYARAGAFSSNKASNNYRIRSKYLTPVTFSTIDVIIPVTMTGYQINVHFYDSDQMYVRSSGNKTTTQTINVPANAKYIAVVVSKTDGTAVTMSFIPDIGVTYYYKLPYVQIGESVLQNGYLAFAYLQQYYLYDMPAKRVRINNIEMDSLGIKKLKNQTLKFPVYNDPNLTQLVKTNMGNGVIEKISINLSSRNANATLKYDTE